MLAAGHDCNVIVRPHCFGIEIARVRSTGGCAASLLPETGTVRVLFATKNHGKGWCFSSPDTNGYADEDRAAAVERYAREGAVDACHLRCNRSGRAVERYAREEAVDACHPRCNRSGRSGRACHRISDMVRPVSGLMCSRRITLKEHLRLRGMPFGRADQIRGILPK